VDATTRSRITVVGIGGYKESGKSEAAYALQRVLGFEELGMSDELNRALYVVNPIIDWTDDDTPVRYSDVIDEYGYTEAKSLFPEVRRLLQKFGTEFGRNFLGDGVWAEGVRGQIWEMAESSSVPGVAITGIRYRNEIQMIKSEGGITVWIGRPGLKIDQSHSSESSLGPEDFEHGIYNDGTVEDLSRKIVKLVKDLTSE